MQAGGKAEQPASKQWGFAVKEALTPSKRLPRQASDGASSAEDRSEQQSWALGTQWKDSPFSLQQEPSTSSSGLTGNSDFKGFKNSCEAGSYTLSPSQILRENGRLEVVGTAHTSSGVRALVKSVVGGLRAWQQPEAATEGLGGTYFFLNEVGKKTAIVKPCDEEPLAPNNPKGFVGRNLGEPGLKPTVRVGEAAMREVAAFLLDYDQFAHVPNTVFVRVTHNIFHTTKPQPVSRESRTSFDSNLASSQGSASSYISNAMASTIKPQYSGSPPSKLASLQEFVQHQWDASEMGCSRFPVADVHRIGILDIRLFNTDRHAGNLLVRTSKSSRSTSSAFGWLENQYSLVPIDHGFCLPEALEPPYLEWLHWPQAKIPFDEEELRYISGLDADSDVQFLRQELPWLPEGSLRTLQVATLLLTKCAAAGLTLAEIGTVASRPLVGMDEEASQLEKICQLARAAVDFEAADGDTSSIDSDYGSLDGLFCGGQREASLTHLLERADKKTGVVMGRRVPLQSAMSGDELLFDLEEEPEGSETSSSESNSSNSSPASNLARSMQTLPYKGQHYLPSEPYTPPRRFAHSRGPPPAAAAPALAQSHSVGLHHRATQHFRKRHHRAALHNHMKASPGRARPGRPAYPPHVVGTAASEMNNVFEGLDSSAWDAFIQNLEDLIEEALDAKTWKQDEPGSNMASGLGVSCPRF